MYIVHRWIRNRRFVTSALLVSAVESDDKIEQCLRENSVLHLLLALGTVWMALYIYNFTKTCVSHYLKLVNQTQLYMHN